MEKMGAGRAPPTCAKPKEEEGEEEEEEEKKKKRKKRKKRQTERSAHTRKCTNSL